MRYLIKDENFHNSDYGDDKYLKNWPMLYILENGKEAYIGESTNIYTRMMQHRTNEKKEKFEKVHLIYSKEFNQSVTLDYESKLIQLLAADEQYKLTNGNAGIADKNYYNKEYYDRNFTALWERLRSRKLVKHTIDEITNSDLFKYSPYKELNEGQREAVEEIFRSIVLNPEQAIVVSGIPGSGKTIVAVFLFKYLRDYIDEQGMQPYKNKKIALVIPQTSLRKTLKNLFKHIYGLKPSDVIGPSDIAKSQFDIVLVDESHRLHQRKNITNYRAHDANNRLLELPENGSELDWIFKQVKCPILFYDKKQVVGPSGISYEILDSKIKHTFKGKMVTYHTLSTQMRVKGGNDYINYITDILNNSVQQKKTFENYEFKIINSFKMFETLLVEKEKENGLCLALDKQRR